jgi:RNA polymerase sigma-70 factor, ECF subfamily
VPVSGYAFCFLRWRLFSPAIVSDQLNDFKTDAVPAKKTESNWADLVRRIEAQDGAAVAELYATFSKGLRYFLARRIGSQDIDDRIHDIIIVVLKAIQSGSLREPERLPGFVRTVAQRSFAQCISSLVRGRQRERDIEETGTVTDQQVSPEEGVLIRERAQIVRHALSQLAQRDQEVLRRFYLQEQSPEQICTEMSLTETQFRLLKSRAKARFGEIGRKHVNSSTSILTRALQHVA